MGLKFTPRKEIERLVENIFKNSRNNSSTREPVIVNKLGNKTHNLTTMNHKQLQRISSTITPKDLMPSLHKKTHFKAIHEIFVSPVRKI